MILHILYYKKVFCIYLGIWKTAWDLKMRRGIGGKAVNRGDNS